MLKCVGIFALLAVLGGAPDADAARRAAARKAVSWLDENLLRLPETQGTPRKPFTYATAGLVYLMDGATRSEESPLPRIVDYLARWVARVARRNDDPDALPASPGHFDSRFLVQCTWPLGQAGLFFAELNRRGLYPEKTKKTLRTIVSLLSDAQVGNGGWGHHRTSGREPPGLFKMSTYPTTLVASTNTVASALGVVETTLGPGSVPGLDRARTYYRKARLSNGNFPYDPSQRSSGRSMIGVSRTGGALLAMYWLGFTRDDPDVRASLDFVLGHFGYLSEAHGSPALNLMQSAWALKLLDEKAWERFRSEYIPRLVAAQAEDGSLKCICEEKTFGATCDSSGRTGRFGARGEKAYVTALHAFILLLDEERLQIGKRKPRTRPVTGRRRKR